MFDFNSLYIIAEAGVNHNGKFDLALKLMEKAKQAGANAIKYQMFDPDTLVTSSLEKAPYQIRYTGEQGTQKDMLKKLMLTFEEFKELAQLAKDLKIDFIVTPFDVSHVALLEPYVDAFKISSGDLTYTQLMKEIVDCRSKPIIMSTGLASIKEVAEALEYVEEVDFPQPFAILHCVSEYPAPPIKTTLNYMNCLKQFSFPVGYSDHTKGIGVAIAAAGLGACIIEKHITLDCNMDGPDHKAAIEPHTFELMVEGCLEAHMATKHGIESKWMEDDKFIINFRRSIKAKKDLKAGTVLTKDDLKIVRPATGLSPSKLNDILGLTLTKDVPLDSDVTWDSFK